MQDTALESFQFALVRGREGSLWQSVMARCLSALKSESSSRRGLHRLFARRAKRHRRPLQLAPPVKNFTLPSIYGILVPPILTPHMDSFQLGTPANALKDLQTSTMKNLASSLLIIIDLYRSSHRTPLLLLRACSSPTWT